LAIDDGFTAANAFYLGFCSRLGWLISSYLTGLKPGAVELPLVLKLRLEAGIYRTAHAHIKRTCIHTRAHQYTFIHMRGPGGGHNSAR